MPWTPFGYIIDNNSMPATNAQINLDNLIQINPTLQTITMGSSNLVAINANQSTFEINDSQGNTVFGVSAQGSPTGDFIGAITDIIIQQPAPSDALPSFQLRDSMGNNVIQAIGTINQKNGSPIDAVLFNGNVVFSPIQNSAYNSFSVYGNDQYNAMFQVDMTANNIATAVNDFTVLANNFDLQDSYGNHFWSFTSNGIVGGNVCGTNTIVPILNTNADIGSSTNYYNNLYVNTINQSSDGRLKKSMTGCSLGLDYILALKPIQWEYSFTGASTGIHHGFLYQDIKQIAPEGTHIYKDPVSPTGFGSLNYISFIAPMVGAIQELNAKINAKRPSSKMNSNDIDILKQQINMLLQSNATLSSRITILESKLNTLSVASDTASVISA